MAEKTMTAEEVERAPTEVRSAMLDWSTKPESAYEQARLRLAAQAGRVPEMEKELAKAFACCGGNDAPEGEREHTQDCNRRESEGLRLGQEIASLRERVATLEAGDRRHVRVGTALEEKLQLMSGRAATAEARVRELERQLSEAQDRIAELAALERTASERADAWEAEALKQSQPPPATAQVDMEALSSVYYGAHLAEAQRHRDENGRRGSKDAAHRAGLAAVVAHLSPTPPPRLREAVGPFAEKERHLLGSVAGRPDDRHWRGRGGLTFGQSRRLVAAYDATGGDKVLCPGCKQMAPATEVLCTMCTAQDAHDAQQGRIHAEVCGADAEDATGGEESTPVSVQGDFDAVKSALGAHPRHGKAALTRLATDAAKYRAAVERLPEAVGNILTAHPEQARDVLRWLLGIDSAAPAPCATLDKARVVEVLRGLRWKRPEHFPGGIHENRMLDRIASVLGLTLDTPPSVVPQKPERPPYRGCHADRDGDCSWAECPQRTNPAHHCPLDTGEDDDTPPSGPGGGEEVIPMGPFGVMAAKDAPTRARIAPTPTPEVAPLTPACRLCKGDESAHCPECGPTPLPISDVLKPECGDVCERAPGRPRAVCRRDPHAEDVPHRWAEESATESTAGASVTAAATPDPHTEHCTPSACKYGEGRACTMWHSPAMEANHAAPAVVWEGDGVRVRENGACERKWPDGSDWEEYRSNLVYQLARALADAKRPGSNLASGWHLHLKHVEAERTRLASEVKRLTAEVSRLTSATAARVAMPLTAKALTLVEDATAHARAAHSPTCNMDAALGHLGNAAESLRHWTPEGQRQP